jgi:hypothetical protein
MTETTLRRGVRDWSASRLLPLSAALALLVFAPLIVGCGPESSVSSTTIHTQKTGECVGPGCPVPGAKTKPPIRNLDPLRPAVRAPGSTVDSGVAAAQNPPAGFAR